MVDYALLNALRALVRRVEAGESLGATYYSYDSDNGHDCGLNLRAAREVTVEMLQTDLQDAASGNPICPGATETEWGILVPVERVQQMDDGRYVLAEVNSNAQ